MQHLQQWTGRELIVSYRWTDWVFKNDQLKVEISGRLPICFRGICRMNLKSVKKNRKITTCNRLDLETLGFWLIMPKILPGHWSTAEKSATCSPFCKFWVHHKYSTCSRLHSPTWSNAGYNSRSDIERRHCVIHKHFPHHIISKLHVTVLQVICYFSISSKG